MVYSPSPPRRSNLVFAHSDAGSGVDPFGNPYGPGDVTYWLPGGPGRGAAVTDLMCGPRLVH
jgi:hypothetical protein